MRTGELCILAAVSHSSLMVRTGFEREYPNLYLFILDPANSATTIHETLSVAPSSSQAWTKTTRINLNSFQRQHAYQLVYLEKGLMSDSEKNLSKILTSARI